MIVKSSMRQTTSGRLKKRILTKGKRQVEFMQLHRNKTPIIPEIEDNKNIGK